MKTIRRTVGNAWYSVNPDLADRESEFRVCERCVERDDCARLDRARSLGKQHGLRLVVWRCARGPKGRITEQNVSAYALCGTCYYRADCLRRLRVRALENDMDGLGLVVWECKWHWQLPVVARSG